MGIEKIRQASIMKQRQSLPLEAKKIMSIKRIREWYDYYNGDVYVAWSGGRDSTVLVDLVWSIYPDVPVVFSNTGLELKEIKKFVSYVAENGMTSIVNGKRIYRKGKVVRVVPKKNFKRVIEEDGFALVGKKQAKMIRVLQGGMTKEKKHQEEKAMEKQKKKEEKEEKKK